MLDAWWERALGVLNTPSGYVGMGTAAAVGVASAVYLLSKPVPIDLGVDYDNQSVILKVRVCSERISLLPFRFFLYLSFCFVLALDLKKKKDQWPCQALVDLTYLT